MADQKERRPDSPAHCTPTPPRAAAGHSSRAADEPPAQTGKHRCILLHPTGEGDSLPSELLQGLTKRIGRLTFCTDAYSAMAEVCRHELDRRGLPTSQPTDAGPPADAADSLALMLISPSRLADAVELIESLRLYAPATVCWWYDRALNPRPRAVTDADIASWSAPLTAKPAAASPAAPPTANPPSPPVVTTRVPPIHTLRTPSSPPRPPQTAARRAANASSGPNLRLAGTQPTNPRPADQQPPKRPADAPLIPLDEEPERDPRLPPLLTEEELQVLLSDDPTPPQRPNGVPPPGSPR